MQFGLEPTGADQREQGMQVLTLPFVGADTSSSKVQMKRYLPWDHSRPLHRARAGGRRRTRSRSRPAPRRPEKFTSTSMPPWLTRADAGAAEQGPAFLHPIALLSVQLNAGIGAELLQPVQLRGAPGGRDDAPAAGFRQSHTTPAGAHPTGYAPRISTFSPGCTRVHV